MRSVYPKPCPDDGKKSPVHKFHSAIASLGLFLWLLFFQTASLAAADSALQQPDIRYLLHVVETSNCLFMRNGSPHNGVEAAAHMRKKGRYFAHSIHNVEDFIRLAASKSLISGKPYRVRCPHQPETTTAAWLHKMLTHRPEAL